MRQPRLALLLTDGPGLRNFAAPRFLAAASQTFALDVWHPLPGDLVSLYVADSGDRTSHWHALVSHRVTALTAALRATIGYAHLFWADTGGMRYNRSTPVTGPARTRLVVHGTRALGRLAASPRRIGWLERLYHARVRSAPATARYRAAFATQRPDVLFCSNQRAEVALPAALAAHDLAIPTATFIFSWDNITSKGRVAAPYDHFLVWSDLMRREMLGIYPEIAPERVHVVGTPQFDWRDDPARLWTRAQLCARIGADPARPLLLYTGGDPTLYTAEHAYVRLLLELQRAGALPAELQIVLRPSPADSSTQYDALVREFGSLIYVPPEWVAQAERRWEARFPKPADADLLTNLVRHADVNINLNSTMTLECALHDRPVVNIAFDLESPPPFGRPIAEFFDLFEHYRPVLKLGAARRALTPEELVRHVRDYLRDPGLDRQGRAAFAALEIDTGPLSATARVIGVLAQIAGLPVPSATPRDSVVFT